MMLSLMTMPDTVTSEEIEPWTTSLVKYPTNYSTNEPRTTEIPWPPMQVLRWKVMSLPLLIAKQSSWLWMVLRARN